MDIHVSNLPFKIKEEELEELFEKYGEVIKIVLVKDHKTRLFKGYGFVTMANKEQAQKAIEGLNGYEILERKIALSHSKKKEEPTKKFFKKAFKKRDSPIVYGDAPVKKTSIKKRKGQGRGTKY